MFFEWPQIKIPSPPDSHVTLVFSARCHA